MTLIYFILFPIISLTLCGEIKNQIYYEFPQHSTSYCVRRLNRTSVVGCSSKSNGNIGLVEVVFNQSHIIKTLSQLKHDVILVLSSELFIQDSTTDEILLNKHIQGLIVLESKFCNEKICYETSHDNFSEDYKLPNPTFSLSNNNTFNPTGTEFGFKNWPFPIVYLNERYRSEHIKLVSCYNKFNRKPKSKRRCGIEIQNFMAAVKSSKTCLRYQEIHNRFAGTFNNFQFCDYFSGMNYVVNAKETVKERDPNSVIVLVSRMDSLSMFERSAFSVNGAITSTALLLSVMKLLMSQPEFTTGQNLTKDVLFLLLDNESYDYIGSNRFFMDLDEKIISKASSVPVNISNLDLILEFGELSYSNFSGISFFHQTTNTTDLVKNKTLNYLSDLSAQFQNFGFQQSNSIDKFDLPPSSSRFFLTKRMMPSIVIADHRGTFLNPFYNSFLDKKRNTNNSDQLMAIANAVASFIFKEATGRNLTAIITSSDEYSPDKIIDCFASNLLCDLLLKVLPRDTLSKLSALGTPIPTQSHSAQKPLPTDYRLSYLLANLLVYLSGHKQNSTANCTADNFQWIEPANSSRQCYKTRIDSTDNFSFNRDNDGPMWLTSTIIDRQSLTMFVVATNQPLLLAGSVITLVTIVFMTLLSPNIALVFTGQSPYNNVIC